MKTQFVTYDQAIILKELGFDEPVVARYINKQFSMNSLGNWWKHNSNELGAKAKSFTSAPLYQQALDFLNTLNYDCSTINYGNENNKWEYELRTLVSTHDYNLDYDSSYDKKLYDTKYEALNAGLNHLLQIIKDK